MERSLIILSIFSTTAAIALPIDDARNEFASELASCAGYYGFSATASENSGHKEAVASFRRSFDRAITLASALSSQKKALASLELAAKSHLEVYREEGAARLILLYSEPCKFALEQPDKRLQYWVGKKCRLTIRSSAP
jgi:hypothetical protein